MNLSKALKVKKKLIAEIAREFTKLKDYNSGISGVKPPYDPDKAFHQWWNLTNKLVELKSKIIIATSPVYHMIFRMAECKDLIQKVRNLDVKNGDFKDRYSSDGAITTYTAFIDIIKRDNLIIELEEEIEDLQNKLETFNSTTKI